MFLACHAHGRCPLVCLPRLIAAFCCLLLLGLIPAAAPNASAQNHPQSNTAGRNSAKSGSPGDTGEGKVSPAPRHTSNFILHTDLPKQEADELIARLDSVVKTASEYWNRRCQHRIECYVARDVTRWTESSLPDPLAKIIIARIGGGTITKLDPPQRKNNRRLAVVYATSQKGVAEHEIVHAFCIQTFGVRGPTWYQEGMAELANLGHNSSGGLQCPLPYRKFFRNATYRSVEQVVEGTAFTAEISDALKKITSNKSRDRGFAQHSLSRWTAKDSEMVRKTRESYRWSWALCHLLCHNDNYADRFRALGQGYLTNRGDNFHQTFLTMQRQLEFEFRFFVERLDVGYRVDLCRWNWAKTFTNTTGRRGIVVRIEAKRGFQPSGLAVQSGTSYRYRCNGRWSTTAAGKPRSGNGDQAGHGQLEAVVLRDFQISQPIKLTNEGVFTAPSDGKLYLRCKDEWNKLADNSGSLTVRLQAVQSGR